MLEHEEAITFRTFEMKFLQRMHVHSKVDRPIAKQLGAKVITTKLIYTHKGDEDILGYLARRAGREIKADQRLDLLAAIPPIRIIQNDSLNLRLQSTWGRAVLNME